MKISKEFNQYVGDMSCRYLFKKSRVDVPDMYQCRCIIGPISLFTLKAMTIYQLYHRCIYLQSFVPIWDFAYVP